MTQQPMQPAAAGRREPGTAGIACVNDICARLLWLQVPFQLFWPSAQVLGYILKWLHILSCESVGPHGAGLRSWGAFLLGVSQGSISWVTSNPVEAVPARVCQAGAWACVRDVSCLPVRSIAAWGRKHAQQLAPDADGPGLAATDAACPTLKRAAVSL